MKLTTFSGKIKRKKTLKLSRQFFYLVTSYKELKTKNVWNLYTKTTLAIANSFRLQLAM